MERHPDRKNSKDGASGTESITYTSAPNSALPHEKVYELRLPDTVTIGWLVERGIARRTAYRVTGKPARIDLATLSKLCQVLKCEPNDILISEESGQ